MCMYLCDMFKIQGIIHTANIPYVIVRNMTFRLLLTQVYIIQQYLFHDHYGRGLLLGAAQHRPITYACCVEITKKDSRPILVSINENNAVLLPSVISARYVFTDKKDHIMF